MNATTEHAVAILERHVLAIMVECQGSCFHLQAFVDAHVTKGMARAICRKLKDEGFAQFSRGLMDEDGLPCGAGYGITPAGIAHLEILDEWLADQTKAGEAA